MRHKTLTGFFHLILILLIKIFLLFSCVKVSDDINVDNSIKKNFSCKLFTSEEYHEVFAAPNDILNIPVYILNLTQQKWLTNNKQYKIKYPFFISYHIYDYNTGEVVVQNGRKTGLIEDVSADVHSGMQTWVITSVEAPSQPGRYKVEFDVFQNNIWFKDKGSSTLIIDLYVE